MSKPIASVYDRERAAVERGGLLPESAAGITSGDVSRNGRHFAHYECETDAHGYHAKLAYPDCECSRALFLSGWRWAQKGYDRLTLHDTDGTRIWMDPARGRGFDDYMRIHGPHWWRRGRGER